MLYYCNAAKKRAFVVIEHKKYTPLLKNPGAITNP